MQKAPIDQVTGGMIRSKENSEKSEHKNRL